MEKLEYIEMVAKMEICYTDLLIRRTLIQALLLGLWAGFFQSGCVARRAALPDVQSRPVSGRIAVLPFNSSNPYVPGTTLSDYFIVQLLQNMPEVSVIERKDLMKILEEQKLTLTGIIRPEKFVKLGSILGVDAILLGTVSTLEPIHSVGGKVAVTVKLVDVASGRILWADSRKIDYSTWSVKELAAVAEEIMQKAARKMVQAMGRKLDLAGRLARDPGESRIVKEARLPDSGERN